MLTGSSFASTQKFERLPFWNNLSYGIKIYGFEVAFNSMTSLLNIIEIQLVQYYRNPVGSKIISR
jgi:hypothetical protein